MVQPYQFPVRGRKLQILFLSIQRFAQQVQPYQFPVRGRKLTVIISGFSESEKVEQVVQPYQFPVRGRKRSSNDTKLIERVEFYGSNPTNSPSGDGNRFRYF